MVFNSLQFALFFIIVYGLYHVLGRKAQNRMLLVASYIFYGAWDWRFLSLIAISTVVDYYCGLAIASHSNESSRKRILLVSLLVNLGILGFFKYFGFFSESLATLFAQFGIHLDNLTLNIVLPVGISFYTFQTLSYTLDIYRRKMSPCRNFLDFALFVSFFPQLVAGPIERAKNLIPQLTKKRTITAACISTGLYLITWGLFKKVVIADNLGVYVDNVFDGSGSDRQGEVLLAVFAFAFQIYCDFSGYSDIARGIARLLGINLMLNFNIPYLAKNPSDFWRRWHISLSTWLRDYLYVSLGGNRLGSNRTYLNLMLVMLLGGLWHGAAWNFVFWGAYHGTLLAVHRLFRPLLSNYTEKLGQFSSRAFSFLSVCTMFVFTLYGWLLFRVTSLDQILSMSARFIPTAVDSSVASDFAKVLMLVSPLLVMQFFQTRREDTEFLVKTGLATQTLFFTFCIYGIMIFGKYDGSNFIYFQF